MGRAEGQSVLITGGGGGLGRALARRFRDEGANVGILDRSVAAVASFRSEFDGVGVGVVGDVRDLSAHTEAVARMVERFGALDTLIANAGIWDFGTALVDLSDEVIDDAFDEVFGINVRGALLAAKAATPALVRARGSIVFTVSNAGFYPAGGGPLYTASKHAVVGLIRQIAHELAPYVRVNGVAPGAIPTDLRGPASLGLAEASLASLPVAELIATALPLPVLVPPEQYTSPFLMLASALETPNTTGSIFNCDGGFAARGLVGPAGGAGLAARFGS